MLMIVVLVFIFLGNFSIFISGLYSYHKIIFRSLKKSEQNHYLNNDFNYKLSMVGSNGQERNEELEFIKSRDSLIQLCDLYKQYQSAIWDNKPIEYLKSLYPYDNLKTSVESESNNALEDIKKTIIEEINNFIKYNPTNNPTNNWGNTSESPLDGLWKLRFTNAPDATFKPGKRGPATTMQYANSTSGIFTNIIEYKENNGKLKSINVIVQGVVRTNTTIDLSFDKVVINRRSRVGLNKLTIPLPKIPFLKTIKSIIIIIMIIPLL